MRTLFAKLEAAVALRINTVSLTRGFAYDPNHTEQGYWTTSHGSTAKKVYVFGPQEKFNENSILTQKDREKILKLFKDKQPTDFEFYCCIVLHLMSISRL